MSLAKSFESSQIKTNVGKYLTSFRNAMISGIQSEVSPGNVPTIASVIPALDMMDSVPNVDSLEDIQVLDASSIAFVKMFEKYRENVSSTDVESVLNGLKDTLTFAFEEGSGCDTEMSSVFGSMSTLVEVLSELPSISSKPLEGATAFVKTAHVFKSQLAPFIARCLPSHSLPISPFLIPSSDRPTLSGVPPGSAVPQKLLPSQFVHIVSLALLAPTSLHSVLQRFAVVREAQLTEPIVPSSQVDSDDNLLAAAPSSLPPSYPLVVDVNVNDIHLPIDPVVASLSSAAKDAFLARDFEALGREVGTLLALTAFDLIVAPTSSSFATSADLALTDCSDYLASAFGESEPGPAKRLMMGLMKGFTRDFPFIKLCMKDSEETLIPQLRPAFNLIFSKKFANVKNGLSSVGRVLGDNIRIVLECNLAVFELRDVYDMIKSFRHPVTFVFRSAKHLILNGFNIMGEIYNAANAFRQFDFFQAGYNIGLALRLLLVGTVEGFVPGNEDEHEGNDRDENRKKAKDLLRASARVYREVQDSTLVLQGVARGFMLDSLPSPDPSSPSYTGLQYTPLEKCFHLLVRADGPLLIAQPMADFDSQRGQEVRRGLVSLAQALAEDLTDALALCKASQSSYPSFMPEALAEGHKLHIALEKMRAARGFSYSLPGRHLVVEGHELYRELLDALNAWRAREFELVGVNTGRALRKLLQPVVDVEEQSYDGAIEIEVGVEADTEAVLRF